MDPDTWTAISKKKPENTGSGFAALLDIGPELRLAIKMAYEQGGEALDPFTHLVRVETKDYEFVWTVAFAEDFEALLRDSKGMEALIEELEDEVADLRQDLNT